MRDPLGRPPALLLVPAAVAAAAAGRAAGRDGRRPPTGRALPDAAALRAAARGAAGSRCSRRRSRSLFCLVLGLPLAWVLARLEFRGRTLLRALVTVPLVLPPVVAGVALRTAFGRTGVHRRAAARADRLRFPFTTWGVVLAHVFVSLPFVVIAIEGAFRSADPEYDAAAATLGATRWTTFRRVTVPLALPGIAAGTGARLGPLARRVRRDDHVQRQLPRHHADHAEPDLRHPAVRPGRRARPQPGDADRLRRRCCSRCATAGSAPGSAHVSGLEVDLDGAGPGRRRAFTAEPGEVLGVIGPNGAGQVHAWCARWPAWCRPTGRAVLDGADLLTALGPGARGRHGVPGPDAVPPPHRASTTSPSGRGSRGVPRAEAERGRAGLARPARHRRARPTASRGSSPAGRRSGSRSPARWRPTRGCCCSTSRSPASTSRSRWRCGSSSAGTSRRTTASRCWSPTTPSTRSRSPTTCWCSTSGEVAQIGTPAARSRSGRAPSTSPGWSGSTWSATSAP